jgi:hypothetical protein
MKITKFDPMLSRNITLDIPITEEQYASISNRTKTIQELFPSLSSEHREFLISGISPQGWDLYETFTFEN